MADIADTMKFLNDAARRYPEAVSLLAGRPPDQFVDIAPFTAWLNRFVESAVDPVACRMMLGQYSDTNGICRDVLATYLSTSQGLPVVADDCIVINGAQEGLLIALATLCGREKVALAADPTYVGLAGAAAVTGTKIETIPEDEDFVPRLIARMGESSPPVGCVYLVPDFANPTGRVLTLDERKLLVAAARAHAVMLLEDSAYRPYRYEGGALPTLFGLAEGDHVILLESFAKTVMPGLRAGVLVFRARSSPAADLASRLSSTKSYTSVASSPITQAALAGCLMANDFDLRPVTEPRVRLVRQRRDALLDALAAAVSSLDWAWVPPPGGFFLTLRLNQTFDADDSLACAAEAGVIVLPMQAFSLSGRCTNEVRLAFSNVPAEHFAPAIGRLAAWLSD